MVNQFTQFRANPKLLNDQDVKCAIKDLTGTAMQGLILKPNPEKLSNDMLTLKSPKYVTKTKANNPAWSYLERVL